MLCIWHLYFFFFNDTATTEIYTLSLHDALPIYRFDHRAVGRGGAEHEIGHDAVERRARGLPALADRKSTRLNSSHQIISYAVFCLKKKIMGDHPAMNPAPYRRLPAQPTTSRSAL